MSEDLHINSTHKIACTEVGHADMIWAEKRRKGKTS